MPNILECACGRDAVGTCAHVVSARLPFQMRPRRARGAGEAQIEDVAKGVPTETVIILPPQKGS